MAGAADRPCSLKHDEPNEPSHDQDERRRLEREEFEATGFVANMERLLIAVDESPNGRFAASTLRAPPARS